MKPISEYPNPLQLIYNEVSAFFALLDHHYEIIAESGRYNSVRLTDNKLHQGGQSLQIDGHTFVAQFVMPYSYSANKVYMSLAIYDIALDKNDATVNKYSLGGLSSVDSRRIQCYQYGLYMNEMEVPFWVEVDEKYGIIPPAYTTPALLEHWVDLLLGELRMIQSDGSGR